MSSHPISDRGALAVVAAGKAAAPMAEAFARLHEGRVREILVARGGHPLPDAASVAAGVGALTLARETRDRGERLVVLLSGGASAMLAAPAPGTTLDDKIALTRFLLRSGLPIASMNAIRKHVSAIKGGQLAAAAGRSITFAISDVHGPVEDDPSVIGSGPTVADPSTFADALSLVPGLRFPRTDRPVPGLESPYFGRNADLAPGFGSDIDLAPSESLADLAPVWRRLERGARGELPETPKPGDPRLADAEFVLAGSRRDAMDGAAGEAARLGYVVERIAAPTLGDAAAVGRAFIEEAHARARRVGRPACIIASGETTVRLTGTTGVGGRNQELALSAAMALARTGDAALASVGTDGIDGPTNAAGAIADSTTIPRAQAMGLDASAALARHDSHPFFRALGDLIVTGPTGTNVGDLQIFISGSSR